MKSKFKENGKNRILAVIASAVMFCLVVLLIIVTRKTDAVADTSVIINGKEYSQDNKMKILEIVSEVLGKKTAMVAKSYTVARKI